MNQPAVLLFLGHRCGGLVQTPVSAFVRLDRKDSDETGKNHHLGTDPLHVLQHRDVLHGTDPVRRKGKSRVCRKYTGRMARRTLRRCPDAADLSECDHRIMSSERKK